MTTTPLPPTKHDHPDCHQMIWTQSELVWIQARDAQWMERITALESANQVLADAPIEARKRVAALEADRKMLREALTVAVTQNEHDMLMTGDELRAARKVLEQTQ